MTDPNNQITQFGYVSQAPISTPDPYWRVLSTTDPLGNVTWNTYTPATSSTNATKETALNFPASNPTSTMDILSTLDGLGRLVESERRTAPGSTSFDNTIQYGYGWNSTGRVLTQTIAGGTALTSAQFDAIGRTASVTDGGGGVLNIAYAQNDVLRAVGPPPAGENSKQRQIEYDVLGRVTSVCEITSTLSGYGKCSQTSSQPNGYFTVYAYDNPINSMSVTQNATGAVQTRTYQYDGVGRLTSETNPETGTIAYSYDTDSTCGTSNGDLVKKVDAAGNVICYAYDALHRVTGMTYPSGPNSASTPSKTFVYDATTFSCTNSSGSFVKGRLAEAFTGPSSAKVTDIAYCYSPRGETADTFESTPNSKGYYHITATYWANGVLNILSGVPSHNAWTFGVDSEGRPNSAVDGTTTNLVTATTYNAASQPTNVSLGSGDSDTYTYDSNTGRMKTYQFNIGSTPKYVTGTLGWNQNWSLGSLVIADAFNSADAQTCAYSNDDLARIQSVSCGPQKADGTTWGQTFSYDPFGNISKSGTSSFLPLYTGSGTSTNPTNQYYQIPGGPAGATNYYDLNGNLTYDKVNTYAWDSDANAVGINLGGSAPIGITYDAFDRAVEENNSGTYKQILYGPTGKLALMAKQVANNVFVPLPGGEQATYTQSTIRFRHYDWLGSSRFESNMGEAEYGDAAYAPFGETYSIGKTPYVSFTGQQQDTIAGVNDFLFREYSTVQGRWLSSDPAGIAAADPTNPQSWNRYTYALNNPLSNVDPEGMCTLFIGGVNDNQNNAQLNAAANSKGGIYVAPYDGESTLSALLNIAAQALAGPDASSQDVATAMNAIASDPNGIQIVAFSGGAQAFSSAAEGWAATDPGDSFNYQVISPLINQGALDNITQITYLSPGLGPGGGLYIGPDTTVFHGHGLKDFGATFFARLSGKAGSALPCSHSFDCEFKNLSEDITSNLTPCPPKHGGGGGAGGSGFPGDQMPGEPCVDFGTGFCGGGFGGPPGGGGGTSGVCWGFIACL